MAPATSHSKEWDCGQAGVAPVSNGIAFARLGLPIGRLTTQATARGSRIAFEERISQWQEIDRLHSLSIIWS